MKFDAKVLRALLRLARRREAATCQAVALRAGTTLRQVRVSARRLRAAGLVEIRVEGLRLTMEGLAVAVAALPSKARGRETARRPSRAA